MMRVAGLVFAGALATAATTGRAASPLSTPLLSQATISPSATYPAPPAQVSTANPGGYTAAPMPDSEAVGPLVETPKPGEAQWSPSLFTGAKTYRGEGFTPGSTVQASQTRNHAPAPGVSLNVPLE